MKKDSSIQKLGYKKNSPHKNRRSITINSNSITMDGVDIPLLLLPDNDEPIVATSNSGNYLFPNSNKVKEVPMKKYQQGGQSKKIIDLSLPEFTVVSSNPTSENYNTLRLLKNTEEAYNSQLYPIWSKSGKPKIKDTSETSLHSILGKRPHFDYPSNTMYVNIEKEMLTSTIKNKKDRQLIEDFLYSDKSEEELSKLPEDYLERVIKTAEKYTTHPTAKQADFLAELAHALQLKVRGLGTNVASITKDYIKNPFIDPNGEKNDTLYKNPSTFEYEAHSVIEPQFDQYTTGLKRYVLDVPTLTPEEYYKDENMKPRNKMQLGGQIDPMTIFEQYLASLPEEEQDELIAQLEQLPQEEQQKAIMNLVASLSQGQQMQEGGQTNMVPIEVEGKETVRLPNGKLEKFEGPKHKDGGIPTQLPEGSYVFSEHLKAPKEVVDLVLEKSSKRKKEYSYADLSKKFPTKPFEDKIANPDTDKIEKQAAAIKLQNHNAMLETIFAAQEMDKAQKGTKEQIDKAQTGKNVRMYPYDPLIEIKKDYLDRTFAIPEVLIKGQAPKVDPNADLSKYRLVVSDANPSTLAAPPTSYSTPVPQGNFLPEIFPDINTGKPLPLAHYQVPMEQTSSFSGSDEMIEMLDRKGQRKGAPAKPLPKPAPRAGKPKPAAPAVPEKREPRNIEQLPGLSVPSSVQSITPRDWGTLSQPDKSVADIPADDKDYPGRKFGWDELGISRQLSGTIFDSLMAASDQLNVDAPQFRDNRKNPLFTRFVDFEDEDVNKMYNQSMMQIMNSNVPEQVKQSQIANLNSKLQEFQGKEDFARYQNYQQKLVGDTEKLQKYMDTNIDQHTADIESYRQKIGRINDLKNQFKAQKKARVVNPIRQYLDFVQEVDLQNQVYSDQFKMNPYTGKVNFFKSKQDPLKEQEERLRQFASTPQNTIDLGGGAKMIVTPYGVVVQDIDGKIHQMDQPSQSRAEDSKQVAMNLMNR